MSIKIKMLKNLISVLCAATIATSGVVTSVSAVNTTGNTSSASKTKKEEVKQIANKFASASYAFTMWARDIHLDRKSHIYKTINDVYRAYADLGNNFDNAEKVNKYKTLVTESIQKLKEFKKNYKKEEVKQTSNELAKTNEKLDKKSDAGKIQAVEKIQANWRGYKYRNDAKNAEKKELEEIYNNFEELADNTTEWANSNHINTKDITDEITKIEDEYNDLQDQNNTTDIQTFKESLKEAMKKLRLFKINIINSNFNKVYSEFFENAVKFNIPSSHNIYDDIDNINQDYETIIESLNNPDDNPDIDEKIEDFEQSAKEAKKTMKKLMNIEDDEEERKNKEIEKQFEANEENKTNYGRIRNIFNKIVDETNESNNAQKQRIEEKRQKIEQHQQEIRELGDKFEQMLTTPLYQNVRHYEPEEKVLSIQRRVQSFRTQLKNLRFSSNLKHDISNLREQISNFKQELLALEEAREKATKANM